MGFGLKGPFAVIVEFIKVYKPICTFTFVDIYTSFCNYNGIFERAKFGYSYVA